MERREFFGLTIGALVMRLLPKQQLSPFDQLDQAILRFINALRSIAMEVGEGGQGDA